MLCAKVDKLLLKYKGKYAEMFKKLEAKYSGGDSRRKVQLSRVPSRFCWFVLIFMRQQAHTLSVTVRT